ncbi:MAG: UDP-glucose 4-epimerase GalE, partial [Burkholderiales bacterium]
HTWVELANAGYQVVGVDNFSNSSPAVLPRLERLMGTAADFTALDVRDTAALSALMRQKGVKTVVHFAALKAVGESAAQPLQYYQNNIGGLLSLCDAMAQAGVGQVVFSSSATVYGQPDQVPILESADVRPVNPYGHTKLMGETILRDIERARGNWAVACLRYFNPVGAHASGLIGESPSGVPNNLMPYVARVAAGTLPELSVFGGDYDTPDGTGVRDYVHVVDLARAHVAAVAYLQRGSGGCTVNIGTGRGYSVLEVVRAYEQACGRPIGYRVAPRRAGDVAECYADPSLARSLFGWEASLGLDDMCRDSWRWQSMNPAGYEPAVDAR